MRIVQTKVFTYSELSDEAKERARNWYRERSTGDDFWHESMTEPGGMFDALAKYCGWTIGRARGQRTALAFNWSGFSSQGDGLAFAGAWRASDVDMIGYLADFGIHETNAQWFALVERFEALAAIEPTMYGAVSLGRGNYPTGFEWGHDNEETADTWDLADMETEFKEAARSLMCEMYCALEREHEYQNSDDVVAENIEANEYEFTEEGEQA